LSRRLIPTSVVVVPENGLRNKWFCHVVLRWPNGHADEVVGYTRRHACGERWIFFLTVDSDEYVFLIQVTYRHAQIDSTSTFLNGPSGLKHRQLLAVAARRFYDRL
jgi:hypothetical protein